MAVKQQSVSMPMASAGLIGVSSDMKIAGIEIEPKMLVAGALVFILLIKVGDILVKSL